MPTTITPKFWQTHFGVCSSGFNVITTETMLDMRIGFTRAMSFLCSSVSGLTNNLGSLGMTVVTNTSKHLNATCISLDPWKTAPHHSVKLTKFRSRCYQATMPKEPKALPATIAAWSASAFLNHQRYHLNMTWRIKRSLGLAPIVVR